MARKLSLAAYKRKLWKVFSEYIRRRDADINGFTPCISCGDRRHFTEMNAGHYHPKSLGLQVYFVETNVHSQCPYCNLVLQGNQVEYSKALIKRYGETVLDELAEIKKVPIKYHPSDYEEMIAEYKAKLEGLNK